jgi:hypothetical protein
MLSLRLPSPLVEWFKVEILVNLPVESCVVGEANNHAGREVGSHRLLMLTWRCSLRCRN